jgi:hypothetical protein
VYGIWEHSKEAIAKEIGKMTNYLEIKSEEERKNIRLGNTVTRTCKTK